MTTHNSNKPQVKCPTCQTQIEWSDKYEHRPFCSESCKNKDFIGWANEEKKIPGNPTYDDLLSDELEY